MAPRPFDRLLGGLARLWRSLWSLLHAWWSVDRIRISPRDGQLLRLAPGSVIVIGAERWLVSSREAEPEGQGRFVRYRCGDGQTQITLAAIGVEHGNGVLLTRPDGRVFLAGEVEVFAKEIA